MTWILATWGCSIQKHLDDAEINVTIRDVEKAEKAIQTIETAQEKNQAPDTKPKNRLRRFIDDLSNENSSIYKTLKQLRKGRDYAMSLAKSYNKIAPNMGMPSVPPLALEVIEKL